MYAIITEQHGEKFARKVLMNNFLKIFLQKLENFLDYYILSTYFGRSGHDSSEEGPI